jgi:glycosyltransferase involved in cell wall biosynthesis
VRLILVIPSLASGGAEHVMALLANHWAGCAHQVTLVTMASPDLDRVALHPAVTRVGLGLMHASGSAAQSLRENGARLARLRAALRAARPHAAISFLPSANVLTVAAARTLRVPVIVAERIDPREEPIPRFWSWARRLLYPYATAVVVQTIEVTGWAERFIAADRIHVIPNPVAPATAADDDAGAEPPWLARAGPQVVAMGRLTSQKGFDLLLRAFAACHADHPSWSLVILGEGEERPRLEALAAQLGIDAAVAMPGHVAGAAAVLRRADLFVLSSRYEGFPNALLDAMTCGLPVIATDCPSGPRRIVRHAVDGLLVERDNVQALSAAMRRLMDQPEERRRLASRAVDVVQRFSTTRVMAHWDALLARYACAA